MEVATTMQLAGKLLADIIGMVDELDKRGVSTWAVVARAQKLARKGDLSGLAKLRDETARVVACERLPWFFKVEWSDIDWHVTLWMAIGVFVAVMALLEALGAIPVGWLLK